MIYEANIAPMTYLTLVVRASTMQEAIDIATAAGLEYGDVDSCEVYPLDPNGPSGVLVEDPS